jgi:hypothetical protein
MFCPQCGGESAEGQHYCRSCGTNLKVIGKVVTFTDAISKSDGVPTKVKEKIGHVADEVSRAMEKVNTEIARGSAEHRRKSSWRKQKTAEERRERHFTKGTIKFFTGGGLSIFLYFLTNALQLRLPADVVAAVPFAIDPVVRVFWLIGLIPMLSGLGHIIAGFSIKPQRVKEIQSPEAAPLRIDAPVRENTSMDPELTIVSASEPPASVTDRTTNILDRDQSWRTRETG